MRSVLLEIQVPDSSWVPAGSVSEVEPPASISSDDPGGRRVIMFGWWQDEPGVWESRAGADIENELARVISTEGFDPLSDLTEPYQLEIGRMGIRIPVRFTLLPDQDL